MVANNKEKEFRKNLVKFLKSYEKEKNIKGDAQKIVDNISSKELHDMAEDFLKTKKGLENMKGGKKSRRRRRKRKNKTRKIQHGGQWELFGVPVVYMVGAAVAAVGYRVYNRVAALRRAQEEFPGVQVYPPDSGLRGIVGLPRMLQNEDYDHAWTEEDSFHNVAPNFSDAMVQAGNELLAEDAVERRIRSRNSRRNRSRTPERRRR